MVQHASEHAKHVDEDLNEAKVSQINELFFAVLNDICSANYEMTDIFKTSRLSAYSIKVVPTIPTVPVYE